MTALEDELDLTVFREIVEMKKEAEEFLKSHSEEKTRKYRAKQNIVLNCEYLLAVSKMPRFEEYESVIDSIEEGV